MLHRAGLEMWEGLSNSCNCFCQSRGIYYKSDVDLNTEEISTRYSSEHTFEYYIEFPRNKGGTYDNIPMAQSCFRMLCN